MFSILYNKFFTRLEPSQLASSQLRSYDQLGKQEALDAIDILIKYKSTVHAFTNSIVDYWSLPQRVMERYGINDVDQLNDWLDDLSLEGLTK